MLNKFLLLTTAISLLSAEALARNFVFSAWTRKGGNYFVLGTVNPSGNLGGLSGANSLCLTQLTANAWLGKENVLLVQSKVRAWLCDGSSCNNLRANTTYSYARAGSATNGGSTFVSTAAGVGPGVTTAWNGTTFFGVTSYIMSGRTAGTGTAWGTTPSGNHCSNYSSTSGNYQEGDLASTGTGRWNAGAFGCSANNTRIICIVDDDGT